MIGPPAIDALFSTPVRIQLAAMLASVNEAEFALVRDSLGVSDSVLSKHLRQLEEVGYVKRRKGASGGHLRTWLALTREGRAAFREHVAVLEQLTKASLMPIDPQVGGDSSPQAETIRRREQ